MKSMQRPFNFTFAHQRWLAFASGLALIALAAWLRWRFAQTASPHVDEFITLWAARRTLEQGIPLMPSGIIYPRGLPISYLIAAVGSIAGITLQVGRLVNVGFGVGAVALCFFVGWRSWGLAVGLLAALGLSLAPEAIQWSGSARFYAPMQFFALLTVWAAYLWIVDYRLMIDDCRSVLRPSIINHQSSIVNHPWLFVIAFILALFTQEINVFLYPPLCGAMLWWRGWRFWLRPAALAAHLVCIAAIGARYALEIFGQPGQFETFQRDRPYLSLLLDVPGAWAVYAPLILESDRLLWTIGLGVAVVSAGVALLRMRGAVRQLPAYHQATLFFVLPTLFVLAVLLTVGGGEWREVRFFLAIQPMWLLLGAAGVMGLVFQIVPSLLLRTVAAMTIAVVIIATNWLPVQRILHEQGSGFAAALAYVAVNRQPGDVVLSAQPSACAFVIGNCTYYARQEGYAPYVIDRNGKVMDRYTGLPLLSTPDQLEAVIKAASVIWFVIDSESLTSTRYGQAYRRLVFEQFDLPFAQNGGLALRAAGWQPQSPLVAHAEFEPPVAYGPLQLVAWERSDATPGQPLTVTLFWRSTQNLSDLIHTSVQLVSAAGATGAQDDTPIARGFLPLRPDYDAPLPDPKRLALPANLASGRYRIDTVAYDVSTGLPLAEQPLTLDWFWVGVPPAPPRVMVGAEWVNGIQLIGHSLLPSELQPGKPLTLELQWTTTQPLPQAYTTFAHLVAPDGQLVAQHDRQPEDGFYPTWGWDVGEPVVDAFQLDVPSSVAPGIYRLLVGWYDVQTGERLRLEDGADLLALAELTVK